MTNERKSDPESGRESENEQKNIVKIWLTPQLIHANMAKYNNNPTLLKRKRCEKCHIYYEFNQNLWKKDTRTHTERVKKSERVGW